MEEGRKEIAVKVEDVKINQDGEVTISSEEIAKLIEDENISELTEGRSNLYVAFATSPGAT